MIKDKTYKIQNKCNKGIGKRAKKGNALNVFPDLGPTTDVPYGIRPNWFEMTPESLGNTHQIEIVYYTRLGLS